MLIVLLWNNDIPITILQFKPSRFLCFNSIKSLLAHVEASYSIHSSVLKPVQAFVDIGEAAAFTN